MRYTICMAVVCVGLHCMFHSHHHNGVTPADDETQKQSIRFTTTGNSSMFVCAGVQESDAPQVGGKHKQEMVAEMDKNPDLRPLLNHHV